MLWLKQTRKRRQVAQVILMATWLTISIASIAKASNTEQVRQLQQTNSCVGCDLSDTNLRQLNLSGANLRGANLSGADLRGVNLSGANLSETNLSATNLTRANLTRANLKGARSSSFCDDVYAQLADDQTPIADLLQSSSSDDFLVCSIVEIADIAQMVGIEIDTTATMNLESPATTIGSLINLFRTEGLYHAHTRTTFERANLEAANFSNTRFRGADFRFATLRRAEFLNADLVYAIFFDAALEDIQNADLRRSYINKDAVREVLLTRLNQIHEAFLAQVIQARQLEARIGVGTISRAQQSFYLENDSFAADLERLNLGFHLDSANYQYRLLPLTTPQSDVSSPNTNRAIWIIAIPRENNLKSYIGVVWVGREVPRFTFFGFSTEAEVETTFSILCESNQPTTQIPQPPHFIDDGIRRGDAQCPEGFSLLN